MLRRRMAVLIGCTIGVAGLGLGTVIATSHASAAVGPTAIPLGDGHVTTTPKKGYVDSCGTTFAPSPPGATPPWINTKTHTWNSETKVSVQGSVSWPDASFSVVLSGSTRVVTTNDLPVNHTTGVFPIASTDPAHAYDGNPNHIAADVMTWSLPANPVAARHQSCTSPGPIGILTDGVVLYNALDANGRDAPAHEVLDRCGGHPDQVSRYHHHYVPPCMLDAATGRSTLVGYAIDGYGIYVERNAHGALLTNANLDRCHGKTSKVMWNGKETRIYHYDATIEYPYTVGCYHGTPI
ncbi:MAG TPA: YHYH protein [Acidimicrobiales bacterium]|nr:YHYH protein [Acidimicrobiales bacterium]